MTVDIGEPVVAAAVAVGEALVVEAHEVENRGVQVVDVDLVLHGVPAEVVGRTVDQPALWPYGAKRYGEAKRLPVFVRSSFGFSNGSGWPFIAASPGLGSKRSTCDGPPDIKRKITRFARAGKCAAADA